MRFLRPLLALAALSAVSVDAALFQIDASGDDTFQLYVSHATSPTDVIPLNSNFQISGGVQVAPSAGNPVQPDWRTPSRYVDVDLYRGDVVSIYVHNVVGSNDVSTNPSAIVARLRELNAGGGVNNFKVGGENYITDGRWECAWRHETTGGSTAYNPARLTGNAENWARVTLPSTTFSVLAGQTASGSTSFSTAQELKKLGQTGSIWNNNNEVDVRTGLGYSSGAPDTPYWIFGNPQSHTATDLAHHGWCRFKIPTTGPAPPGGNGDPVFTGFQGQVFQFHGLPDEHFNLVSSPSVQLNAHFVYLSSGKCDYNETACFTHPGTYMDVLGFTIAETQVKLVAGTHEAGLRVWVNDIELSRGARNFSLSEKTQASIKFHKHGKVQIHTELMDFEVSNSDMFMNVGVALMNQELLRVGSKKHTITDKALCKHNEGTYNHELVESKVSEKYPITTPLHGLIGQTWRNLKVCGREWMGTVQDYVVSSLFGTDYHYKYFQY